MRSALCVAVLTAIIVPAVITGPEGGLFLAGNSRRRRDSVTVALVTSRSWQPLQPVLPPYGVLNGLFTDHCPAANRSHDLQA